MRVRSLATIIDDEVRCEPDDVFEIRDEIGEIYLARNLVHRLDAPKKPEPVKPDESKSDVEDNADESTVETAAFEGAPENALGRGARRSRRKPETA